jgi:TIR domain-containing protein
MKIFISYRRDDSAGYAGRLFDHLTARFGAKNVFMDIDTIQPGEDFRKVVQTAVGTCDVVLVMIGKQWLGTLDAEGRRRLDDPRDWVRVEIASALANPRVRVIPVLVREARMPGDQSLPEDIRDLAWRNAIELSDGDFRHDANKLIEVIEGIPGKPADVPAPGKTSSGFIRVIGIILGLAGLGLILWPVTYAISAYPDYVEGDWLAFPIACGGIILAVISLAILRRKPK